MSVSYWGDLFYGIDRINHEEFFDKEKEKRIIINVMKDLFNVNVIEEMEREEYDEVSFGNISGWDLYEFAELISSFLPEGVEFYAPYSSNEEISLFGINFVLPWEVKEIVTQKEVDKKIYEALKPILKDNVKFIDIKPFIKRYNINGADDYITFYEY